MSSKGSIPDDKLTEVKVGDLDSKKGAIVGDGAALLFPLVVVGAVFGTISGVSPQALSERLAWTLAQLFMFKLRRFWTRVVATGLEVANENIYVELSDIDFRQAGKISRTASWRQRLTAACDAFSKYYFFSNDDPVIKPKSKYRQWNETFFSRNADIASSVSIYHS